MGELEAVKNELETAMKELQEPKENADAPSRVEIARLDKDEGSGCRVETVTLSSSIGSCKGPEYEVDSGSKDSGSSSEASLAASRSASSDPSPRMADSANPS